MAEGELDGRCLIICTILWHYKDRGLIKLAVKSERLLYMAGVGN